MEFTSALQSREAKGFGLHRFDDEEFVQAIPDPDFRMQLFSEAVLAGLLRCRIQHRCENCGRTIRSQSPIEYALQPDPPVCGCGCGVASYEVLFYSTEEIG